MSIEQRELRSATMKTPSSGFFSGLYPFPYAYLLFRAQHLPDLSAQVQISEYRPYQGAEIQGGGIRHAHPLGDAAYPFPRPHRSVARGRARFLLAELERGNLDERVRRA